MYDLLLILRGMKKGIIGFIIVVALIAGGYGFFMNKAAAPTVTPKTGNEAAQQQPQPTEAVPSEKNVIVYTDTGYSPSSLTVKLGETVVFKNNSSRSMWTASAMHPTHTAYDGTSLAQHCPNTAGTAFDECTSATPGSSWSFTFAKAGTWHYHNHVSPSDYGTVIVE